LLRRERHATLDVVVTRSAQPLSSASVMMPLCTRASLIVRSASRSRHHGSTERLSAYEPSASSAVRAHSSMWKEHVRD